MNDEIYSRLPTAARRLVDEIEKATAIEIQVKSKADRSGGGHVVEVEEGVVGVLIGPDSITIESPHDVSKITDEDFVHELLHLHRTYVVNVPHLFPRQTKDGATAAGIENWLEHVVIYGRQIRICDGLAQKLDTGLADFWSRCPWDAVGPTLKFNLISRYMVTHLYGGKLSKAAMKEAITTLALGYSIRDVARRCMKTVSDKPKFAKSVLEFCEIPSKLFWLRRYDLKKREFVWSPI